MTSGLGPPDPNPVERYGLCLLSLDGGGVRGLSSLYILQCIMTLVNSERNGDHVKPCDAFDLIGGTSTGGYVTLHSIYDRARLMIVRKLDRHHAWKIGDGCPRMYRRVP